jgi:hypothetical protein
MFKVNYKLMQNFLKHFYNSLLIFIIQQQKCAIFFMAYDISLSQIMVTSGEMTSLHLKLPVTAYSDIKFLA